MASSALSKWLRPEVYPLFAAVGVAVGICGFQLVRNVCINPEVREDFWCLGQLCRGEKYAEHGLRKFLRNKSPEIMPAINGFFTNPK
ncbi:unnamed protein product [Spirodela intermedia]|uniref:Uncharacterized protein n=1 Tax=Spirodela intermedia TaxID=51605 RepID=A0A7I8JLG8_SPIIN|nr:unnamed protein product [Spirodela intermedia]CAA6670601.1 unnamed protein product [Spirodela intermedia]